MVVSVESFCSAKNVATHAADHVETVGLAVTGELLGQVHGLLADAEELLEAGVEARVVRRQANVEQMRVQTLDLKHDGADVLGARRNMNALSALDGAHLRRLLHHLAHGGLVLGAGHQVHEARVLGRQQEERAAEQRVRTRR